MTFPKQMQQQLLYHIDPSLQYRPDCNPNQYRKYTINADDPVQKRVFETYLKMHTYQTVEFVKKKRAEYGSFDKIRMPIMAALNKLNDLIDESDPDVDMPNIVHAFQTAEEIRAKHPEHDWFHLTGLIHDLGNVHVVVEVLTNAPLAVQGKVMAFFDEPQWAVVGDTFPVGCQYAKSIVYRDFTFILNPDNDSERFVFTPTFARDADWRQLITSVRSTPAGKSLSSGKSYERGGGGDIHQWLDGAARVR
ncbi:inositol oxygenase-like [Tropilaelaps mercedesae]|uniref:Inositol oxygenase n=1 Tax=Tropilaelaps mercedesae TaxID=418985 RepID=A0A1V9X990_9ACAR|nr:inositol oxygenase-like [Tropilaelaps mercedesae]